MNIGDILGTDDLPISMRIVLYIIDNVFIAIAVGLALWFVEQRLEHWRERSARRVASDQFVAEKIRPLMETISDNMPLIETLAGHEEPLSEPECGQFDDCHARQVAEVEKLEQEREFNEAAFAPYNAEVDEVIASMAALQNVMFAARAKGTQPSPGDYLPYQLRLRDALKKLSNKSSVAVHAH